MTVTLSGPLFDGQAAKTLERGIEAGRGKVAGEGENLSRLAFMGSIRRDQGRFLKSLTVIERSHVFVSHSGDHTYSMPITVDGPSETIVTSDLATYGPWLEGTGSRNETTRFKGYWGFRRAGQALNDSAGRIMSDELNDGGYIKEMQ
jgi:hypothetical protein